VPVYMLNTKFKEFLSYMLLFFLFAGYLLTRSFFFLIPWLSIIYFYRFDYWKNKVPLMIDQDVYERGLSFGTISREEFANHIKIYNYNVNTENRMRNDPYTKFSSLCGGMVMLGPDILEKEVEDRVILSLKRFEKSVLEKYPDTQTKKKVEGMKEALFKKYPHLSEKYSQPLPTPFMVPPKTTGKASGNSKRSYHTTPTRFFSSIKSLWGIK